MGETRQVAEFVYETSYEDIPPHLIDEYKGLLLDCIGCGFIGAMKPWSQVINDMLRDFGGKPEASLINQDWKTDVARAAFANGSMMGGFELEPNTATHAGGSVLPAVLAVAERDHMSGKAFMTASILGAEVCSRLGRTAVGMETDRGFHVAGPPGPLAAAAAVGKLRNFDVDQIVNALGIAGSHSGGLVEFAWEGANTKRMHLGRAAQMGVESALMAGAGFTGPSTVLEGRFGYFNAFSLPVDSFAPLVDGLGKEWRCTPPSHKSYGAHITHQAVIQAIEDFKAEHGLDATKITRVVIRGAPMIMDSRRSVRNPASVMGGQYSLPFTTAVSLVRDMSNPLVYDDSAISDPLIRKLAQLIELVPVQPDPNAPRGNMFADVELEVDGQTYNLPTHPYKGSPANPYTWDELCDRFRRYAGLVIKEPQVSQIIDGVSKLEEAPDVAAVAELIAAR